jgi:hypothetical protein
LIIQRAVEDEFDAWLGRARYERRPDHQLSLVGVAVGQDPGKGGGGIPQSPSCGFPGGSTECVTGGKVTVTFSKSYWRALRAKNVRIEVGGGATRRGRAITFPISARGEGTTYRDSFVLQAALSWMTEAALALGLTDCSSISRAA